jgi:hypothetical protein
MDTVSKDAIELIDNIKNMDPNARLDKLKNLTNILTETLKRGEEKVALAKSTFDAVQYTFSLITIYSLLITKNRLTVTAIV